MFFGGTSGYFLQLFMLADDLGGIIDGYSCPGNNGLQRSSGKHWMKPTVDLNETLMVKSM